jgi:organic radical activating enzyme
VNTRSPPAIPLSQLRELWVHTGTACNLSCPFCHEGSKPGDTRIGSPTLELLASHLQAAAAGGVQRFAFTGGEPLILKGILEMLLFALQLRPVLVLTNGTAPFIRRSHHLAVLRTAPHALEFRVSIDYPEENRHDASRGLRNFRKALEGLRLLHAAGFATSIARQVSQDEDPAAVAAQYRQLLRRQRLPEDLPVLALPGLGALGTAPPAEAVRIDEAPSVSPACGHSRMLLMREGRVRWHACPLTDDDAQFDTGATVDAALDTRVLPRHARCALCHGSGVDYAGPTAI